MKLSEIKRHLATVATVTFKLPGGTYVPEHFHVTEVGLVTRHFIDCVGTERLEKVVNFQLWDANDYEHRLKPGKLANIIALAEERLGIADLDIEVEYGVETIGKYGLQFDGTEFQLVSKKTACLAQEACGSPLQKEKLVFAELEVNATNSCTPGGGCC